MRLACLAAMILMAGGTTMGADARDRDLRDIVGSTHTGGKYNFTEKDFVNEGADKLLALGTRVIKLWFTERSANSYPFNSDWPEVGSLTELAQTPYFRRVFDKPFTVYMLEAFRPGIGDQYHKRGMTREEIAAEKREFYELTKYLLTTYKGTGKTFILQNWEGDWVLRDVKIENEPKPKSVQGMIDWLNARQDGVEQARREFGMRGVTVAHAAEVNLMDLAMKGGVTVANDVLPKTHCDLVSYSAWDTLRDPGKFRAALDYLNDKMPDSRLFGSDNVFVGEYGAPENNVGGPEKQLEIIKGATETALDWGARWVVYWELYCNEPSREYEGRPTNTDCRGFWLVRPDGTKAPVWNYFAQLMRPRR
ncbi:MAG: hypothetical protein KBC96_11865 [Armatimonadetes bacterium]|nr:hypothetical protein [Armatimonadota bacterium]